jgi:hypothetical protein
MRIEVSPGIPIRLDGVTERFLSTHISISSRLIDWFIKQDSEVQATVLGLHPDPPDRDELARMILGRMRPDGR